MGRCGAWRRLRDARTDQSQKRSILARRQIRRKFALVHNQCCWTPSAPRRRCSRRRRASLRASLSSASRFATRCALLRADSTTGHRQVDPGGRTRAEPQLRAAGRCEYQIPAVAAHILMAVSRVVEAAVERVKAELLAAAAAAAPAPEENPDAPAEADDQEPAPEETDLKEPVTAAAREVDQCRLLAARRTRVQAHNLLTSGKTVPAELTITLLQERVESPSAQFKGVHWRPWATASLTAPRRLCAGRIPAGHRPIRRSWCCRATGSTAHVVAAAAVPGRAAAERRGSDCTPPRHPRGPGDQPAVLRGRAREPAACQEERRRGRGGAGRGPGGASGTRAARG